jgi:hypothetical protein
MLKASSGERYRTDGVGHGTRPSQFEPHV